MGSPSPHPGGPLGSRQLRVQGLPTLTVYASGPRSCPLDFRAGARRRITCKRAPEGGAGRRENLNKTGILDGEGPRRQGGQTVTSAEQTTCELWLLPASHVTLGNPTSDPSLARLNLNRGVCGLGQVAGSANAHSPQDWPRRGSRGSQLPGGARALAGPPASQNHTPPLQFPSKGGSRHHFVFSQGGRLAACQSPARGSQVLTKHRPEQEGGARGSGGASCLPRPLPCTPTPGDELRAAGAALADNSKLLPPLLGRRWGTLLP